ncbi:hypothetical protein scyTo_0026098, partial [Scyliorhinus torazame]|nr:hypothetical protein [Scyliorhinus torazame]
KINLTKLGSSAHELNSQQKLQLSGQRARATIKAKRRQSG